MQGALGHAHAVAHPIAAHILNVNAQATRAESLRHLGHSHADACEGSRPQRGASARALDDQAVVLGPAVAREVEDVALVGDAAYASGEDTLNP